MRIYPIIPLSFEEMCGIVGYIGEREAKPVILDSLKRLEYRGYDSCGIAIMGEGIKVFKDRGRVSELAEKIPHLSGKIGIGHTRWATHGGVSRENAHPHLDCSGKIAVVHNGIITNFQELKEKLISKGHIFRSETDTEVLPHLIEELWGNDIIGTITRALKLIRGTYAFAIIVDGYDGIIVARKESPLIVGVGEGEFFLSSDVPAILEYTDRVIYLEDGDIGLITREGIKVFNGREVRREVKKVPWKLEEAQKGGFEHFMLKEIYEQPKIISLMLNERINAIESSVEIDMRKRDFDEIILTGCGTSYHACLIGRFYFEKISKIPTRVEISSEFGSSGIIPKNTITIALTQSGETRDTIKAVKRAKEEGIRTLAITNVVGSSITRISDEVFYMRAGPEISVAATKTFLAQLLSLYLISLHLAELDPLSLMEKNPSPRGHSYRKRPLQRRDKENILLPQKIREHILCGEGDKLPHSP